MDEFFERLMAESGLVRVTLTVPAGPGVPEIGTIWWVGPKVAGELVATGKATLAPLPTEGECPK